MKTKKLFAALLAAALLAGCGSSGAADTSTASSTAKTPASETEKTPAVTSQTSDTGVGVILPFGKGDFTKEEDDDWDIYYLGTDTAVIGSVVTGDFLRCLTFDPSSLSLDEYVQAIQSNNGFDPAQKENGVPYFEYLSDDGQYKYMYAMYKNNDCFYDVQFGTMAEDYDSHRDQFLKYITGVTLYDYEKPDVEFDSGLGVKITALADLQEVEYDNADWSIELGDATVMFYHFTEDLITSSGGAAGQTLEEHAQWQCDTFGYTLKNGIQNAGNYVYYEYDIADNGCTYYEAVFPASDGFWVASAASMTENYELIRPLYVKWLGTVVTE